MPKAPALTFEPIGRESLAAALMIDTASFDPAWSVEDFMSFLRDRNHLGQVARLGRTIVGYILYDRRAGSVRIERLAVVPEFRRTGFGSSLIGLVVTAAGRWRRSRVSAVICELDLSAQLLFRANDFKAVRVLRGHFDDDAGYLFSRQVGNKL